MADAKPLRLMAEDAEDLKLVSAALQDSVAKAGGFRYQARKRRFSLELNRFRWEDEARGERPSRTRAILGIDGVRRIRSRGLTRSDPELVISLLAIAFEPGEAAPEGTIRLTFAGDGEIELAVECLDITLLDSGTVWPAKSVPGHSPRQRG